MILTGITMFLFFMAGVCIGISAEMANPESQQNNERKIEANIVGMFIYLVLGIALLFAKG